VAKKKSKLDKNMMILAGIAIVIIVAIAGFLLLGGGGGDNNTDNQTNPIAVINTSKGTIKVELYQDKMPKTCENFIKLVNDGFYDGMIFHRIQQDFMIQAGSTFPNGTTKTSPYGNIEFESSDVTHSDGAISMASTGAGVGGNSQFFICDGAQPGLDGSYAAFGKTIEGFDVIRDIADEPHDNSYGDIGGGRPIQDIIINSITIENQ
jgi:cyclophilin family peptidyl-prolyl cis-trans isomerase